MWFETWPGPLLALVTGRTMHYASAPHTFCTVNTELLFLGQQTFLVFNKYETAPFLQQGSIWLLEGVCLYENVYNWNVVTILVETRFLSTLTVHRRLGLVLKTHYKVLSTSQGLSLSTLYRRMIVGIIKVTGSDVEDFWWNPTGTKIQHLTKHIRLAVKIKAKLLFKFYQT